MKYIYEPSQVKLHRIIDGDTMELEIDLGFRTRARQMFRLNGVDTPEIWRPKSDAELDLGRKARDFVEDILLNIPFRLISIGKDPGIYGRWVCDIEVEIEGSFLLLADMIRAEELTKGDVK